MDRYKFTFVCIKFNLPILCPVHKFIDTVKPTELNTMSPWHSET